MPASWNHRNYAMPIYVNTPGAVSGVQPGLVSAGEVNTQPRAQGASSMDNPATWSTIWFIVSLVYLLGIYYGMINVRGQA